jgi:hypothetical protein
VSFRLDGTSHTDPYFQQNQPFPFPDALQEFSIQTSNYSAAQGNSAGAVVNAVTRSGPTSSTAAASATLRDRTFNARNFFSPKRTSSSASSTAASPAVRFSATRRSSSSAGRARTSRTWGRPRPRRCRRPSSAPATSAAPSSGSADRPAVPEQSDSGEPLRSVVVALLKFIPVPGADGRILIPRRIGQQDNQVVTKVDRTLGQKDQLTARYFFDNFHNDPTYTEGNLLSYSNPTLAAGTRMQNIVGGWTRTISSTLLNETRVGYNHTFSRRFPPPGVPSMQELGVRLPIYPSLPSISEINANNFFNIGDNLEASFYRPGIELADRMTWAKGRHNLLFGGEMQRYNVEIRNQFRRAGHFQFAGNTTSGTGNTLADFLLGQLSQFDQGTGEYKDYVVTYGSGFAQDDFRVSNRFTLNLGARLESTPPWHEKEGRIERSR